MDNKRQGLHPGDRVRFLEDVHHTKSAGDDLDEIILLGTKGSSGIVVSFEEYYADYVHGITAAELANYENWFSLVKKLIADCREYPIRFEMILPSKNPVDAVLGKVGAITLIDASSLEKIE